MAKEIITGLLQELEQWRVAHGVDLQHCCGDNSAGPATGFQTELALLYYQTRTRVLWPLARHEGASRMLAEDTWSCLHLFGRLWTWTSEQGHYASLSRHIVSFSPMAVFHIAVRLITQQDDETALQRFNDFASSLQIISSCAEVDSYTATFSAFVQVLIGLINDVSRSEKGDWNGEKKPCLGLQDRSIARDGVSTSPVLIELPGHQQPPFEDLEFMAWISDSNTAFDSSTLDSYFGSPGLIGESKTTLEDLWQEYLN